MLLRRKAGNSIRWERISNSLIYIYNEKVLIHILDNLGASLPSYTLKVLSQKGEVVCLVMGDDAIELQKLAFDKLSELKIKHHRLIETAEEML
jgi:hypothetical protein